MTRSVSRGFSPKFVAVHCAISLQDIQLTLKPQMACRLQQSQSSEIFRILLCALQIWWRTLKTHQKVKLHKTGIASEGSAVGHISSSHILLTDHTNEETGSGFIAVANAIVDCWKYCIFRTEVGLCVMTYPECSLVPLFRCLYRFL